MKRKISFIISIIVAIVFGIKGISSSGVSTNPVEAEHTANKQESKKETKTDSERQQKHAEKQIAQKNFHLPAEKSKDIIIHHKAYSLSYNKQHNTPNWVAWHLTDKHTAGPVARSSKFWADPKISKLYRVDYYDYKDSGYDRGHMCPAGDNKWDETAMYECFYMSNMCPQDPKLNGGQWGRLEQECRKWANTEKEIFIVCGPIYEGKKHETIGIDHKIAVPEKFFKAVMSLKPGKEKAIAFIFTNDDKNPSYRKLATSVDAVEKLTGFDFFCMTDDSIEKKIEQQCDIDDWK